MAECAAPVRSASSSLGPGPPRYTNQQLIPVYTDWANRYLTKHGHAPIHDLTYDLRDPKILVHLVNAVTIGCPGTSQATLLCCLNSSDPVECVGKCLHYLAGIGVNVSNLQAKDLHEGHLGEVLALLFGLSHYKQLHRQAGQCAQASPQHLKLPTRTDSPLNLVEAPRTDSPNNSARHKLGHTRASSQPQSQPADKPESRIARITVSARMPSLVARQPDQKPGSAKCGPTAVKAPASRLLIPTTRKAPTSAVPPPTKAKPAAPARAAPAPAAPAPSSRLKAPNSLAKSALTTPRTSTTNLATSTASSSSTSSVSSTTATANGHPGQVRAPTLRPRSTSNNHSKQNSTLSPAPQQCSQQPNPSRNHSNPSTHRTSSLQHREQPSKPNSQQKELHIPTPKLAESGPEPSPKPTKPSTEQSKTPSTPHVELSTPPKTSTAEKSAKLTALKPPASSKLKTPENGKSSKMMAWMGKGRKTDGPSSKGKRAEEQRAPEETVTTGTNVKAASDQIAVKPVGSGLGVPTLLAEKDKRHSHGSEEDSAYGGTLSHSPASSISANSTASSLSPPHQRPKHGSASPTPLPSTIPEELLVPAVEDSGISSDATLPGEPFNRLSQERKPTLAVKGILSQSQPENIGQAPAELKPLLVQPLHVGVVNPVASKDLDPLAKPMSPRRLHETRPLPKSAPPPAPQLDAMPAPPPPLRISSDMLGLRNPQCRAGRAKQVDPSAALPSRLPSAPPALEPEPADHHKQSDAVFAPTRMIQVEQIRGSQPHQLRRAMRLAYRRRERHDSCEDSSSVSSGLSENFDDGSTDDLTGSSLSDHNMAATSTGPRPVHHSRAKSSGHDHAQREQQRRLVEQQQSIVEDLLQKSRTSQRGLAFSAQPTSSNDLGRVYHTLHGAPPSLSLRQPQVQLSADGETLSVQRTRADHHPQLFQQQFPSATFHCQSLDRQGHLKPFLEPVPLRLQQQQAHPSAYSEISRPTDPSQLYAMAQRSRGRMPAQSRSASVSAMNCPSYMSRSMVFYESDSNLVEHNNNNTQVPKPGRLTERQRLYNEMMAAVNAKARSRVQQRPAYCSLSARLPPNTNEYAGRVNLRLHKLSTELHCSPRAQPTFVRSNGNGTGSQMSLNSLESPYTTFEQQQEIHRLNDEMNAYCRTLYNPENTYHQFAAGLESIQQQVMKVCKKSSPQAQILMQRVDDLRKLGLELTRQSTQSVPLQRQPSVDSVHSQVSHMSAKSNKVEKGLLVNGGGKKSWIRSSFSRAFKGKKKDDAKSEKGSIQKLNAVDDNINQLKQELEEKDRQLGDVRLEALDKAREVDMLRETINRLKNENKALKHNTVLLERRAVRTESRASSRQSLSTCCHEEDNAYENASTIPERSCSSSSSSKRSSGGLNARVVILVDTSGQLDFAASTQELHVGSMPLPSTCTSWPEVDQQLVHLVDEYVRRMDPSGKLGLLGGQCLLAYQVHGGHVRDLAADRCPAQPPHDLIAPSTMVRLKLKGAAQDNMDSLVLESLFPADLLHQLLQLLLKSRRLVINGPTGVGKSNLSRYLARYLAAKRGISADHIKDFAFPMNDYERQFGQAKKDLEAMLNMEEDSIVMIDNTPRKAVDVICAAFAATEDTSNATGESKGPFVVITLNRTSDLQLQELQVNHNVHVFSLYCQMEPVRGFLGRYLRRRIAQDEFVGHCRPAEQLQAVIEFLGRTLQIINDFIKDVNTLDTIGPRIFLQCPLSVDQSRLWFIRLWNTNIVPYLAKVVRENDATVESDPTPLVNELWPWLDGIGGESELRTVRDELAKKSPAPAKNTASSAIDAIYALDLFQEKRHGKTPQPVL